MIDIKLVQQPTADTCTSACISMITGIDISDVINDFHEEWKSHKTNPSEFLSHQGISHIVNKDVFNHTLEWGCIYLLTVASLNIDGGLHHIILDLTGEKEGVFDPNNGKPDKKYYVGWSEGKRSDNEVKLNSWMVDIKIKV